MFHNNNRFTFLVYNTMTSVNYANIWLKNTLHNHILT
jgi:hypothetical protein